MKKQVYMRVKLDPDLRRAFQLSAWRSERSPTNVLRSLIQDCVNLDRSAQGVDLYVWGIRSRWGAKYRRGRAGPAEGVPGRPAPPALMGSSAKPCARGFSAQAFLVVDPFVLLGPS